GGLVLPRQRRLDAAQPRSPDRGRRSSRGSARPGRAEALLRHDCLVQRPRMGTEERRPLATPALQEGRAAARHADPPDAQHEGTATATLAQASLLVRKVASSLGLPTGAGSRIPQVRVAVVDVGANTLRL